ncbi:MAG: SUMF1/EgtB/PvdO family nonheme iron enzyme [Bacteroidota bacterium]
MAKEKENMDPDKLNELLKQSFLSEHGDKSPDDIADFVFSHEYDAKINPRKEQEFLKKISGGGTAGSSLFYLIIVVSTLVLTVVIYFSFFYNRYSPVFPNETEAGQDTSRYAREEIIQPIQINDEEYFDGISNSEKRNLEELTPLRNKELKHIIRSIDTLSTVPDHSSVSDSIRPSEKGVPDESMIRRFKKVKKMMLEKLILRDKKLYVQVFSGRISYMGEETDVDEFYVRSCVITNLEYKTFLVDLLLQGKNDDYEKAKVNNGIWNNYEMPVLEENYFAGNEYNDFPVVNIPYEGALLFCNWLEEEAKQYAEKTGRKIKPFTVRLPYDTEWIHMIISGYARIPGYDGYHTIFDINEGFVDKLLVKRLNSLKKNNKKGDPVYELFAVNRYGMDEPQVLDILNTGFEIHDPFPSDTIDPKRMKDFGKIGHVSEMIVKKQNDDFSVCGFCWKNKEEFMEMMGSFALANGSPYIGMRIVVSFGDAPVYKKPFY